MSATVADRFDARPGSLSVWLTALAALVAATTSARTPTAMALGAAGAILLTVGVRRGDGRLHTFGAITLFGSVLAAGVAGAGPATMLVATGATVVAWDAGDNAIGLGEQLGSRARTRRNVLAHTGSTALVAVGVGTLAFVVFRTASAGQPTTAVALLLVAALLFTVLLDR